MLSRWLVSLWCGGVQQPPRFIADSGLHFASQPEVVAHTLFIFSYSPATTPILLPTFFATKCIQQMTTGDTRGHAHGKGSDIPGISADHRQLWGMRFSLGPSGTLTQAGSRGTALCFIHSLLSVLGWNSYGTGDVFEPAAAAAVAPQAAAAAASTPADAPTDSATPAAAAAAAAPPSRRRLTAKRSTAAAATTSAATTAPTVTAAATASQAATDALMGCLKSVGRYQHRPALSPDTVCAASTAAFRAQSWV